MDRSIRSGALGAALALLALPAHALSITAQMQGTATQANDAGFFDLDPALVLGDPVTPTV